MTSYPTRNIATRMSLLYLQGQVSSHLMRKEGKNKVLIKALLLFPGVEHPQLHPVLHQHRHLELLHVAGHGIQPPPVLVPVPHRGAQDVPNISFQNWKSNFKLSNLEQWLLNLRD